MYRADVAEFAAEVETLLGSPLTPVFYDCGMKAGTTVYYRVRAVDAWGNLSEASPSFAVAVEPPALAAAFKAKPVADAEDGATFGFDGTASRATKGKVTQWLWTFGDGTQGQGATQRHTFAKPGTYYVQLKVGSDGGEWATMEKSVHVRPKWLSAILKAGAVLVEAEAFTGEGGGHCQKLSNRANASGLAISYWHKDVGHWLEWRIAIPKAGRRCIVLKYATGSPQAVRDCRIDGKFPGEGWKRMTFPDTGGWSSGADNWNWQALRDGNGAVLEVELAAGEHTLRMSNLEGGMALDCILLAPADALPATLRGL